jgi:hypothetical protein
MATLAAIGEFTPFVLLNHRGSSDGVPDQTLKEIEKGKLELSQGEKVT